MYVNLTCPVLMEILMHVALCDNAWRQLGEVQEPSEEGNAS